MPPALKSLAERTALGHLTSLARGTPQYVVFLEDLRRMGFMVEVDARGYGQPRAIC